MGAGVDSLIVMEPILVLVILLVMLPPASRVTQPVLERTMLPETTPVSPTSRRPDCTEIEPVSDALLTTYNVVAEHESVTD